MTRGRIVYIPKVMIDEIARVKMERNYEGRKANTLAMELIVNRSRQDEQIRRILDSAEKQVRVQKKKGRNNYDSW